MWPLSLRAPGRRPVSSDGIAFVPVMRFVKSPARAYGISGAGGMVALSCELIFWSRREVQ